MLAKGSFALNKTQKACSATHSASLNSNPNRRIDSGHAFFTYSPLAAGKNVLIPIVISMR
jgi:hypothetical protein